MGAADGYGSGAITKYAVIWFWQDDAGEQQYSHKVYNAASGTGQTVTGLTAGTEYTVHMMAGNSHGWAAAMSPGTTATPVSGVPGVMVAPAVTAGAGELVVSWEPPTDTGSGAITKYAVIWFWQDDAGEQQYSHKVYNAASGTGQTVTGLTAGTEYTVHMMAGNSHGWTAAMSPGTTATPTGDNTTSAPGDRVPGVMVAPAVTAGAGELVVSWEPPTDTGSGAITKYAVIWFWQDDAGEQQYSHKVYNAASGTGQTVTGLTAGTEYTVHMMAGNSHGWAAAMSPGTTATPVSGVPGVMVAPAVTAGAGELVVSWEPPTDTGSGAAPTTPPTHPPPQSPQEPPSHPAHDRSH